MREKLSEYKNMETNPVLKHEHFVISDVCDIVQRYHISYDVGFVFSQLRHLAAT